MSDQDARSFNKIDPTDLQAVRAFLLAQRAEQGIPTPDLAAIDVENKHLRSIDADHRAIQEGQRALDYRRSLVAVQTSVRTFEVTSLPVAPAPNAFSFELTTYSRVGQTALRDGLAVSLRLWDLARLRARKNYGKADFTAGELHDFMVSLGIQRSKASVNRAIRAGIGIFWDDIETKASRRDSRIKVYRLRSLTRVCQALDLNGPGQHVQLPDVAYTGDDYAPYILSAFWHNNKGDYARSTLCTLFGVTLSTLLAWEKIAGIIVTHRDVKASAPTNDAELAEWELQLIRPDGTVKRHWEIVEKEDYSEVIPLLTAGLFDSHNEPLPDIAERTAYMKEQAKRPGSTLRYVWQDTNSYEPTTTRLAPSGRARYVKSALQEDPTMSQCQRATAEGSCKRRNYPRRFEDAAKAVTRKKHQMAKVFQKKPYHKARRVPFMRDSRMYGFRYSERASVDFLHYSAVRQSRELAVWYA